MLGCRLNLLASRRLPCRLSVGVVCCLVMARALMCGCRTVALCAICVGFIVWFAVRIHNTMFGVLGGSVVGVVSLRDVVVGGGETWQRRRGLVLSETSAM